MHGLCITVKARHAGPRAFLQAAVCVGGWMGLAGSHSTSRLARFICLDGLGTAARSARAGRLPVSR